MEYYNERMYKELIDNYNRSDSFEINYKDSTFNRNTIHLFARILNSQGWNTEVTYNDNSATFNITPFFISKL